MLAFLFEWFLRLTSVIFDAITIIPFYLINRPKDVLKKSREIQAVSIDPSNPAGPYRNVQVMGGLVDTPIKGCKTIADLFKHAVDTYSNKPCLGTRSLIKDEEEVQPNGKVFKKSIFGKYHWLTYKQVDDRVHNFANGLLAMGLGDDIHVCTFSETCAHWTLATFACFIHKLPVTTLYATLGEDAIMHGLKETDVNVIVTSVEGVAKFKSISSRLPKLRAIIYFDGTPGLDPNDSVKLTDNTDSSVPVKPFSHVEALGQKMIAEKGRIEKKIVGSDLALIMYTSGSTGTPKGVMMSHSNLLASLAGAIHSSTVCSKDTYTAYLPQAHILELCAELSCFTMGARLGFSSPTTLTDYSSRIKKGSRGDVSILKPTLMAMVPAIMDRVYKSVWDKVNSRNIFRKVIFKWAFEYKKRWSQAGYSTPFVDTFVFWRLRSVIMGGNVRLMLCGSAPLNEDTQLFMNVCFCCPIGQGYGLTETASMGTVQQVSDMSIGRVGPPLICCDIKLVPWEEGHYSPQDKPHPRGEVWVGGGNVTLGYYMNPEKTKEDYKEEGGRRWFATGDIGVVEEDGCLRIIDRKKDLVKLQGGEYVSLGKVEVILRMSSLVDHLCLCADPHLSNPVALVMPNPKALVRLANELAAGGDTPLGEDDWMKVIEDKTVVAAVLADLKAVGVKAKLQKFELPIRLVMVREQWNAPDGFVTESFKLKRRFIESYYQDTIKQLFKT